MRNLLRLVAPGALAAVAACAPAPSLSTPRPELDGTWVLNARESNDSTALAALLADTLPEPYPQRVDAWGSSRDTLRQPSLRAAARRAAAALRSAPARITIVATDTLVTFGFGGEDDVAVRTDGRAQQRTWADERTWQVRARWEDGRLVLKRSLDEAKITEYISRSHGSSRLVVFSVLEQGSGEVTVRRSYDAAR